ncbi:MRP-L47-domain-containing protein [Xylariomycetidae sp. FL2044]|nr:MRP-L47-domain-containing protein [Xylariomycetidae sp. FL2044]
MAMATSNSIRPIVGRIMNASRHIRSPIVAPLSIASISLSQTSPFSSTPEYSMRKPRRDKNRIRGLSSRYRSGPRYRMNVSKEDMPDLVGDYNPVEKIEVNPNHGLWGFFYSQDQLLPTPEQTAEHGRGWTVEELRHKSWDDLHKLWWMCVREQNRIATAREEFTKMKLHLGDDEIDNRLEEVRKTMKSIKHALTERYYVWEDARTLAANDPEIDLNAVGNPYTPGQGAYFEEEEVVPTPSPEGQFQEGQEAKFMAEEPKLEKVDPSALEGKPEAQQPPAKP